MHRTFDCVGNTRVLELCLAQRLGDELVVALGAFVFPKLFKGLPHQDVRHQDDFGLGKRHGIASQQSQLRVC